MNFIQSSFRSLLLPILFATLFVSCKKDKIDPVYPVEGLWVGKYGNGTTTPGSGYSMVVEAGGKITVADGISISTSSKGTGTWTLTGTEFTATYTYTGGSTFSIKADWSNSGKMTNGTWGNGTNTSGSGTWFMDRTN
jgi:hypothetical protein